ncbi:hypothetical protein BGX31_009281 [Mortierella sp. GBA43]|nr:hypothetical protein BGX31_009281 [Mortierella sp. GBA43]
MQLHSPRFCVCENTDHYLRAELEDGKHGYIKVAGDYIRIIPDIKEASKFFLYGDQDQVQIGYCAGEKVVVFTVDQLALPVELSELNKGIAQAFKMDTLKGQ